MESLKEVPQGSILGPLWYLLFYVVNDKVISDVTSCYQFVYCDFSTLYTNLPHNLIKDKHIDLIERTFQREGWLSLPCM